MRNKMDRKNTMKMGEQKQSKEANEQHAYEDNEVIESTNDNDDSNANHEKEKKESNFEA